MPQRLLIRMNENRAISSGRYLRKSCPIMSRPRVFRMKEYAASPTNCALPGTMAFLRAITTQKASTSPKATRACSR